MTQDLRAAALSYLEAGLSVLPCMLPDKEPAFHLLPLVKGKPKWDAYKTTPATPDEVNGWFSHRRPPQAIGIIGGRVSGNLEVLDIDDAKLVQPWSEMVKELAPQLFPRLVAEKTLRGRLHVFYRCEEPVPGSQQLAVGTLEEGRKGLIETKAEAGYVCVAPSPGYRLLQGDFNSLPVITGEQRNLLIQTCRAFTRAAQVEDAPRPTGKRNPDVTGDRPGDEFNRAGDWRSVLTTNGWNFVRQRGDVEQWRRPGKDKGGISATWNHVPNALYVFTTGAHPLEFNRAYSPFAMLATLDYGGDYQAAARALYEANRGPGSWPTEPPPPTDKDAPAVTTEQTPPEPNDEAGPPPEPAPAAPSHLVIVPDNPNARERPMIYAGHGDLGKIIDQTWAALVQHNVPPKLFRFGSTVAQVAKNSDGDVVVRNQNSDAMREHMARSARWYLTKPGGKGKKPEKYDAKAPADVAKVLLAGSADHLPALNRTINAPIMAPSGAIVDQQGYDAETRTYYVGGALKVLPVPEAPTQAQVHSARDLLMRDLLVDFPFIEAEGATGNDDKDFYRSPDRANALAMFILPFARELVDGPTPLHLIEKPTPGSGASLIFQVLGRLVKGGDPAIITEATNEDEWRKRITSTLMGGPEIVAFDNLRRRLDSSALAAALTTPVWEDRRLGESENVRIPVRSMWIATGNNPGVSSEIARRCISIRIDPRLEKPWEREPDSFRHPRLLEWANENRPRLIQACLTMLKAWHAAGRPQGEASLGSYEQWASVVGGVLQVAGVQGFLGNRKKFYDRADREGADWGALVAVWWGKYKEDPIRSKDVWIMITKESMAFKIGNGHDHAQIVNVGRLLQSNTQKRFMIDGKLLLLERTDKIKNAFMYRLVCMDGGANDEPEEDDLDIFDGGKKWPKQ